MNDLKPDDQKNANTEENQLEENLKAPEVLPLLTEEVQKRLGSI